MNPGMIVIMVMHTDGQDNTIRNWKLTNYIYQVQYKENVLAELQNTVWYHRRRRLTETWTLNVLLYFYIRNWNSSIGFLYVISLKMPVLKVQNAVQTCAAV